MKNILIALSTLVFLSACDGKAPPSSAPQLSTPPDVATTGFLTAYAEETIPMSVAELRAFMREKPLISFLEATDQIANPVASGVLKGNWHEPGAVRWLQLSDGHYVVERSLQDSPEFYKYQVFVFTNAVGRGVEQIVGEQRFVPEADGTRFEWTYNIKPKNAVTRLFVRSNLPEIEGYIANGLSRFAQAARASVEE